MSQQDSETYQDQPSTSNEGHGSNQTEVYTETDLASGSFIENWPIWLRWMLFLPTAILGGVIASVLFYWLQILIVNVHGGSWFGISEFIIGLGSSAVLGATFVYLGSWMAPKYQFETSLVLLVIISSFGALSALGSLSNNGTWEILSGLVNTITFLVASIGVVIHVKNEM